MYCVRDCLLFRTLQDDIFHHTNLFVFYIPSSHSWSLFVCYWCAGRKIRLGEANIDIFADTLRADAALLESLNIMDYSLLVGIHDKENATSTDDSAGRYIQYIYRYVLCVFCCILNTVESMKHAREFCFFFLNLYSLLLVYIGACLNCI